MSSKSRVRQGVVMRSNSWALMAVDVFAGAGAVVMCAGEAGAVAGSRPMSEAISAQMILNSALTLLQERAA